MSFVREEILSPKRNVKAYPSLYANLPLDDGKFSREGDKLGKLKIELN